MLRTILATALLLPSPALSQDFEIEISFYLQPDRTGQNTENKSVALDGSELTIEESGEPHNRYVERDATAEEAALLIELVRTRLAAVKFVGAERPEPPYVEVQFEFDGETRTAEVEEIYPLGAVPTAYVALQRRFFDAAFE